MKEVIQVGNNYPYFPQKQQSFPRQQYMESPLNGQFMGIKGRPVSSLEEARAMSIDFDGSIFYFPDLANQRIYTKKCYTCGGRLYACRNKLYSAVRKSLGAAAIVVV